MTTLPKRFFSVLYFWLLYFAFLVFFCVFKYHAIQVLILTIMFFFIGIHCKFQWGTMPFFYGFFRDYHCGLLGYLSTKTTHAKTSQDDPHPHSFFQPNLFSRDANASKNAEPSGGAVLHSTHSSSFFDGNNKTASHSDSHKGKNSEGVHQLRTSGHVQIMAYIILDSVGAPLKRKLPEHLLEPENIRRKFGIQANVLMPGQEIAVGILNFHITCSCHLVLLACYFQNHMKCACISIFTIS